MILRITVGRDIYWMRSDMIHIQRYISLSEFIVTPETVTIVTFSEMILLKTLDQSILWI